MLHRIQVSTVDWSAMEQKKLFDLCKKEYHTIASLKEFQNLASKAATADKVLDIEVSAYPSNGIVYALLSYVKTYLKRYTGKYTPRKALWKVYHAIQASPFNLMAYDDNDFRYRTLPSWPQPERINDRLFSKISWEVYLRVGKGIFCLHKKAWQLKVGDIWVRPHFDGRGLSLIAGDFEDHKIN